MVYIPRRKCKPYFDFRNIEKREGKYAYNNCVILKRIINIWCYIEIKKEIDINKGKWLGVGGKLENGETPEECLRREVREETGYELNSFEYRGLVIFNYNADEPLFMYLYTSSDFNGVEKECDEGV